MDGNLPPRILHIFARLPRRAQQSQASPLTERAP
jgi:hypothetical protein